MGSSDGEVSDKIKARELKEELRKLVSEIIEENEEENDHENGAILGTINKAIIALCALAELKLNHKKTKNKKKISLSSILLDHLNVPNEFRCPISGKIMSDPVVIASGQTYDRPFINQWLKDGNRTCPQTQQVLSHTMLTPNYLVRELIMQWCKNLGIELPPPPDDADAVITDTDRSHLTSLLGKLSSSLSDQKQAAKEIRTLTKRMPSFRTFFGESTDAIPQLLNPLSGLGKADDHPDLQEDLITTIMNLSIHDNNKKLIAEDPLVIPLLVESLKNGTIETRANAAAALFTLSALDSNKELIGRSGALKPLIELLEEGNPLVMKDVASAVFNLCLLVENRGRALHAGAARVVLQKIKDGSFVDEMLAILAVLANHKTVADELVNQGAVSCLSNIIWESTCERIKENCIAILYSICVSSRYNLRLIKHEDNANGTISMMADNGTTRARRKAKSILDRINRDVNLTHTA